ncbi:hypothetical protein GIB67_011408, partial [Kingdonia uniflora]
MPTSLSIGRYPTQVPYDDAWNILSNAKQLLTNIDSSHIKSGNVGISYLRMYLTTAADRDNDITIARAFILFMMEHLRFQTANDTVPLGYLAVVADLDEAAQYDWGSAILASLYHGLDTAYWFYEYCGVGHPIVKDDVKFTTYSRLKVGHSLTDSQRMENIDLFRTTVLRADITPIAVTSASVHSLSQDFSLPGEAEGPDPRWHMEWTGRHKMLPIARLRDPPPISSSYGVEELWHLTHGMWRLALTEFVRDTRRLQELTDENDTLRRHLDSVDEQLYAHGLYLRRGRDVRMVPLPAGGGTRTRQGGSGPRTRGG